MGPQSAMEVALTRPKSAPSNAQRGSASVRTTWAVTNGSGMAFVLEPPCRAPAVDRNPAGLPSFSEAGAGREAASARVGPLAAKRRCFGSLRKRRLVGHPLSSLLARS